MRVFYYTLENKCLSILFWNFLNNFLTGGYTIYFVTKIEPTNFSFIGSDLWGGFADNFYLKVLHINQSFLFTFWAE